MTSSFSISPAMRIWLVLGFLIVLPTTSFGWGNEGHQTVGAIADRLLVGSKASQELNNLLKQGETLSNVSIWADCA